MVISFLATPALPESACKSPAEDAKSVKSAKHGAKESPIVCDLSAFSKEERRRHDELGAMIPALKTGVHELPDGYEFRFPSNAKMVALLAEWAEQEHRCCPFFDLDLRIEPEDGAVWLRLTGRPGTKDFIREEGARWISD